MHYINLKLQELKMPRDNSKWYSDYRRGTIYLPPHQGGNSTICGTGPFQLI